jgi:hypothetical protein
MISDFQTQARNCQISSIYIVYTKSSPSHNSSDQKTRIKRRKIEQHIPSNELLSRKITEFYIITTKVESPTHSSTVALNEHTVSPLTCFPLSTMIIQR